MYNKSIKSRARWESGALAVFVSSFLKKKNVKQIMEILAFVKVIMLDI